MIDMQNPYDLYLAPQREDDLPEMIALAKHMGFHGISVSLERILHNIIASADSPSKGSSIGRILKNTLKSMAATFSRIGTTLGMEITARVTTSWHDPLREKYKFSQPLRNVLVAFQATSEEEVRRGLKYWYPYLVTINIQDVDILSQETCNLSRQFYKPIELSLRGFICSTPPERGGTLRKLQRKLDLLNKRHFKIIFSTGAKKPLEMRNIRQIRSLLETIGIKKRKVLHAYQVASDFLFHPKPAVLLDELNERDKRLLQKLERINVEAFESPRHR